MAKQFINIGIEGNDGTGDSIRDAFNKTNENFTELYAVFGQGGQISFTSLSDTPDELGSNKIPVSNSAGNAITMRGITSGGGISVDFATDPNNITLSVTGTDVASDLAPGLGGPLNANGFAIANLGVDATALNDFNTTHGTNLTLDALAITKGYADKRYIQSSGSSGSTASEIRIRPEPADASGYTKTISGFINGNLNIPAHGFNSAANGLGFIYRTTGSSAVGLTNNTTYYIRFVNDNTVSLHTSSAEATNDDDITRVKITASGGSGIQTITDADYDDTLAGFYLSTEAVQRQSTVRRQGDAMTGTLFLSDHPGDLAGSGTPNGADDLQAATKYYVDNTSYASTANLYVSTSGDDDMVGVPVDKFGRSSSYAYASLAKAAQRAQQIIETSPLEPGPYVQTITFGTGAGNSTVVTAGVTSPTPYSGLKALMQANRLFIIKETSAFINQTYPDFAYDINICERDVGLIQDAIVIDVLNSLTANVQSIQAGKRYYNSNSGLKAINQQQTETLAAIAFVKSLVINNVLSNVQSTQYQSDVNQTIALIYSVNQAGKDSVSAKFDIISNIIQNFNAVPPEVEGSTYTITINNNSSGYVDQNQPNNKDLVPGKVIRGKISGALGQIVSITAGASVDTVEMLLLEPIEFVVSEELEYGNKVQNTQITIRIESGIYYEDFPIKLPANVSIKGDEFRRTIIRPKDRRSQSIWADLYFFRDTTFDGLNIVSQNYGRHYLTDSTTTKNIGPTYTNTGGYSTAANAIKLATSTIQTAIVNYVNSLGTPLTTLETAQNRRDTESIVAAIAQDLINGGTESILGTQGKFYDVSLSANYKAGITYIGNYINLNVIASESTAVKTLVTNMVTSISFAFDPAYNPPLTNDAIDVFLMNDATIVRNITVQGHGGFMEVLDPSGQILTKSPYTQTASSFCRSLNRQAFRGGMFVDGFAGNIEARVVTVNSAFNLDIASDAGTGLFLRKPLTPAPFFIGGQRYQVTAVVNYDQAAGTATIRLSSDSNDNNGWDGTYSTPYSIIIQTAGNRSLLANDFTQVNDLGYGLIVTNGALSEQVSTFTYYCYTAMFSDNGGQIRALNCSSAQGVFGLKAQGSNPNELIDDVILADNMVQTGIIFNDGSVEYEQNAENNAVYVYDLEFIPYSQGELEIDHGGAVGIVRYEISNIQTTTAPTQIATRDGTVYKVNLSSAGNNDTSTSGLAAAMADGDKVIIRSGRQFRFDSVNAISVTRPSTAVTFKNDPDTVYRSIAFSNQNSIGTALPLGSALVTFETIYDSVKLAVNNTEAQNSTHAGAGTTMGATQGDVVIAIDVIADANDLLRINQNNLIFAWDGKVHRITSYTNRTTYGTITIQDVNDINTTPIGEGIQSPVYRVAETVTLRGVLPVGDGSTPDADITVSISTCRATGHDFLDIGTGGFNTTNYPNSIYGAPQSPVQAYEVIESGKGRVFYVTTDQDGFFRVGKYFTVDQGTGTVTFSASISLSNLDGIGFKRGVVIAEFSTDSGMTDNASDTVPTESAVRAYVNRRLHIDHNNQLVIDPIGAGFIARDGSTSFTDTISAGGFNLSNLADPGVDQDAATKSYVDQVNYDTDQVIDNRDVSIINPIQPGQLLVFNGAYRIYTTPAAGGLFGGANTITGSVSGATGTIIDLIQEVVPGYGMATRITYSADNLPTNFNTNDTIDNGLGVTANVIDGPIYEMGNGVEDNNSDISITATRNSTQTTIDLQLNAGSIINADVSSTAAIQQSKLAMNAATTRADAVGITQADLGLVSFDAGDFTVTDGWVTLKSGDVDLTDLQNIAQYQALGRNTSGTGAVEAVSYSSIVGAGGGLEDSDFVNEISSASDPGQALIKTGTNTYSLTNVTNSREANSIVKTDNNGMLDVSSLAIDGTKIFDVTTSELKLTTPGTVEAYAVIGSTEANTVHTFSGNEFGFGGSSASASTSNDNGLGQNSEPALAASYIYTKYIESDAKTAQFTGIALGSNNPYIVNLDESSEGKVAFVADGVVPVIATSSGLIPGNLGMDVGTSTKRYRNMYAQVFDGVATSAQYADLAERFKADYNYEPGTVLMFGGINEVTISSGEMNSQVAGVVSTDPAYLMNTALQHEQAVELAMMGRVPCKVIGKISKGDMLITSRENGVATASKDPKLGTVIGKALENYDSDQVGVIEIVVGKL